MRIKAIRTHRIEVNDCLEQILDQYIQDIVDEDIVAITSKIISVIQGRFVSKDSICKNLLIQQEADLVLETDNNPYDLY
ncbi:MAG: coenzyme F420-0:L-glutamate ligase [Rickettsia endosymbiont of Pseudomimeciton antennatum]|nr:coenzyme F420-0:L-glutamate ligase [Rickettsia endosymbiont of Pseudomimeciton antennatum]